MSLNGYIPNLIQITVFRIFDFIFPSIYFFKSVRHFQTAAILVLNPTKKQDTFSPSSFVIFVDLN
jgi:hypothetical protein